MAIEDIPENARLSKIFKNTFGAVSEVGLRSSYTTLQTFGNPLKILDLLYLGNFDRLKISETNQSGQSLVLVNHHGIVNSRVD